MHLCVAAAGWNCRFHFGSFSGYHKTGLLIFLSETSGIHSCKGLEHPRKMVDA